MTDVLTGDILDRIIIDGAALSLGWKMKAWGKMPELQPGISLADRKSTS